ncbi:MAG: sigma-70 family RNA polymerase sigma factor [Planctomycetes bacterium]|nr:sigma-70 family RNA polymerase sigma factor [Planctomycetota bacterium]
MPASVAPPVLDPADARAALRARGVALLRAAGRGLEAIPGASGADGPVQDAALATSLMDLYRCTGDGDVFECLVQWTAPGLARRVRSRLRTMGLASDAQEVLQDAIVNIYRYPDRFRASRPGAFAAWSSTIVDNAIRRQLRDRRRGPVLAREDPDLLLRDCADEWIREPSRLVQDREECEAAASAYALLLQIYLLAFGTLSDRERFVLEMVEVRGRRYAELASVLAMRPEALKMVVFRARKRVLDRLGTWLAGATGGSRASAAVAGLH